MRDPDEEPPRQARYGLMNPPYVYRTREDALAYRRLVDLAEGAPRRVLRAPAGEWWVVTEGDAESLLEDADGFAAAD